MRLSGSICLQYDAEISVTLKMQYVRDYETPTMQCAKENSQKAQVDAANAHVPIMKQQSSTSALICEAIL